jgi:hypothetical protein
VTRRGRIHYERLTVTLDRRNPDRTEVYTVVVEIAIDAIAQQLGHRAAANTTGRATAYGGCLIARAKREV